MNDYRTIFNARGHHYNKALAGHAGVRRREREALLERLAPRAGETIADAPAGGGYVADGLRALAGDAVKVICIEPAERFASAIGSGFVVLIAPLERTGLPDACVDAVASLAGLHHFEDKRPVYQEWARIIKPGGRIVVADVECDTVTARFLNGFVHEYTPGGHEGTFFLPGELTHELEEAGFHEVREERVAVPWEFANEAEMACFCHGLFSLSPITPEVVAAELPRWLDIQHTNDGLSVDWSLRYAVAQR